MALGQENNLEDIDVSEEGQDSPKLEYARIFRLEDLDGLFLEPAREEVAQDVAMVIEAAEEIDHDLRRSQILAECQDLRAEVSAMLDGLYKDLAIKYDKIVREGDKVESDESGDNLKGEVIDTNLPGENKESDENQKIAVDEELKPEIEDGRELVLASRKQKIRSPEVEVIPPENKPHSKRKSKFEDGETTDAEPSSESLKTNEMPKSRETIKDLKPEEIFSPKNVGLFEKMGGKAKEFAASLYENVAMRTLDRFSIALDRGLYARVDAKIGGLEENLSGIDKNIEQATDRLKKFDEAYGRIHELEGGVVSKKVEREALKERESIEKNITDLQSKKEIVADELQAKMAARLEYGQNIEAVQNRINEAVQEKVKPHLEKAESLKNQAEQYRKEIDSFKADITECQKELESLEAKLATGEVFNFERAAIKGRTKEIRAELKRSEALLKSRKSKNVAIVIQLDKTRGKIEYWEDFKKSFEGAKPDYAKNNEQRSRIGEVASRSYEYSPETMEREEIKVRVDDYLKLWNDRFATTMKLDRNIFKYVPEKFFDQDVDPNLIESAVSNFNEKMSRGKRLKRADLSANFRTMRRLINKK